ncbi:MAG: acyl carrier protein [Microscillaceae bacterium]|nr:acyl carrier protein [Microscillaceae bacterium]
MTDAEINQKVNELIIEVLFAEEHEVKDSATLRHDLWAESFDIEDLCEALEKAFKVKLDTVAWNKVKTVGDVKALVKSTLKA